MSAQERAAVIAALNGPTVTAPTRATLLERLDARYGRQFLSETEFARLRAVALRLVPHDPAEMDLSGLIDQRLHQNLSDGWRYADTPADGPAYQGLLAALPSNFETLSGDEQDAAIHKLQADQPHPFEDLLAELTEGFMAHPLTQYRFGYAGFMDAPGWPRVGPNELEAREIAYGESGNDQ
ncbi:gluconate 2-dehydrogenase subunit 3 family protein [Deinococcus detaillensis]|uniref:Gluconate 2-dehydrogenase subunit 3 family protein n=1 Tax=Deinococcus detaillensis TaxID=2592048 RepID=A0A553V5R7_9DEIO|nr:gluconate 2-dehydrogenase subunit 3 family protein [Deinococcus detaillensis]TSA87571.1 gluconate 2-dehydrogenase subunit 3 family protein [Deinococcus detaillensis]